MVDMGVGGISTTIDIGISVSIGIGIGIGVDRANFNVGVIWISGIIFGAIRVLCSGPDDVAKSVYVRITTYSCRNADAVPGG